MRSLTLRHSLLLVFLIGGSVATVMASDNPIHCGNDNCCQAMDKLMTAVNKINSKYDEQAKDLEELKNTNLASTAAIVKQLETLAADIQRHDDRLKAHVESPGCAGCSEKILQSIYGAELGPRDCSDIRAIGHVVSGIYRVYPGSDSRRVEADVYCDFRDPKESWLVFQRRKDGSVKFERLYRDYQRGFGNLTEEFWLGNEKLSALTMNRRYKLRIELEDFEGEKRFAEYSIFSVKSAADKYRLTVGGYSGNAGDSLTYSSDMQFSTSDSDNDAWSGNCAATYRGAWWHNACHYSNLNGFYFGGPHKSFADGIEWYTWRNYYYSFKTTEMKIAAY